MHGDRTPVAPGRPHIERTPFTPQEPPREVKLWFCPACGAMIRGTYNLDPAKKRCTKSWHLANPVPQKYVAAEDEA